MKNKLKNIKLQKIQKPQAIKGGTTGRPKATRMRIKTTGG